MDEGGDSIPQPIDSNSTVFDASQYAFFGKDVVEEVELGGLEDEEEDEIEYVPAVGVDDEVPQLDGDEGSVLGSFSEVDGLAVAFRKLNKAVSVPGSVDGTNDWGSRGSSFAQDWLPESDSPNWYNQHGIDAERAQENKRWSPQLQSSHPEESYLLHRTSSHPEQQKNIFQHHHFSSEPILVPKSSFISHPPPGGRIFEPSSNQSHNSYIPYLPGGNQLPLNAPSHLPISSSQLQFTGLPNGSPFGGHLSQFGHRGLPVDSQPHQRINHTGLHSGDNPSLTNNILLQQLPNSNGLMPPQLMQQQAQQHRMHHQFQPSFGHVPGLQPQLINRHLPPAQHMMTNFEMLGSTDLRDQRPKFFPRGRQGMSNPNHGFDASNQWTDSGWPKFRAKYMTADEIENILKAQLAATHSNDPYVDDYYHQACLAKKSGGAKLRHHFCPTNLKDFSSRARLSTEPHAFLKVDALGRVSFSSIRRPRPLLEVDPPNSLGTDNTEQKGREKPLEQEPMLAARVTIEDGLSLLLDVDDIDRFLQFNQLPDVVMQLRGRREVLLEGLASSLQLVDPLGKNGHTVNLAPKDDLVFLRLVSLPKGRKLLCSVRGMDLRALGACLASVVCSAEHPPLRPLGSSAGEGASVILISALERATELLRDPHTAVNCSMPNRTFWQASFDAFFKLLTKYCISKYDTTVQSLLAQGLTDMSTIGSETTKAMSKEMPVQVLRASLPHTNEQQRKGWLPESKSPNWYNQHGVDAERAQENKRWSPLLQSSHPRNHIFYEHHKNIFQHHHFSSEPILVPKSSFTSHPPPEADRCSLHPTSHTIPTFLISQVETNCRLMHQVIFPSPVPSYNLLDHPTVLHLVDISVRSS
ncbi:Obg-like ATPase 1-like [Heracleum sosnowskyi]|uniref:Obg-like ATPase 1-like n=1 Tax=Heracleum sosnowskyi TaxID=360622 RepID=A0AAD8HJ18_9APIA|nr:Obg-like ATPase 1-like [Heracleum sosnowskyi]